MSTGSGTSASPFPMQPNRSPGALISPLELAERFLRLPFWNQLGFGFPSNVQRKTLPSLPSAPASSLRLTWPAHNGLHWKLRKPCRNRSWLVCFGSRTTLFLRSCRRTRKKPCSKLGAASERPSVARVARSADSRLSLAINALPRAMTLNTPQSLAHPAATCDRCASADATLRHSVRCHPPELFPPVRQ